MCWVCIAERSVMDIEQCLEGRDDENCDLVEMNKCHRRRRISMSSNVHLYSSAILSRDWPHEMQFKNDEEDSRERKSVMIVFVHPVEGRVEISCNLCECE